MDENLSRAHMLGDGPGGVPGAASGIGLAVARLCAADGMSLLIASDDADIEDGAMMGGEASVVHGTANRIERSWSMCFFLARPLPRKASALF